MGVLLVGLQKLASCMSVVVKSAVFSLRESDGTLAVLRAMQMITKAFNPRTAKRFNPPTTAQVCFPTARNHKPLLKIPQALNTKVYGPRSRNEHGEQLVPGRLAQPLVEPRVARVASLWFVVPLLGLV